MDDLARGWAIVWANMHGHGAVWIGSMVATSVATSVATWVAIWIAVREDGAARKRAEQDADDNDLRPKPRTLIQGSEKDYRRQRRLD